MAWVKLCDHIIEGSMIRYWSINREIQIYSTKIPNGVQQVLLFLTLYICSAVVEIVVAKLVICSLTSGLCVNIGKGALLITQNSSLVHHIVRYNLIYNLIYG